MPPKKAAKTASKKTGTTAQHSSYRDMIKDAIQNLKERNGSSRQSIKKYVQANNKITVASPAAFDAQFNKAIKAGVEKGEFTQPKGPSGPVKLAKKDADTKPAPKKATTTKTAASRAAPQKAAAPKPAAAKKTTTTTTTKKTEKPAAKTTTKKAGTTTKKTAGRPKANTAKPRESATVAPAIVEQPKVIRTTKSGRVTKTNASPAAKTDKSAAGGRRSVPKKRT